MKEKIKLYDKEISKNGEAIQTVIIILLVFIIGFIAGCTAMNNELKKQNKEKQEHINDLERLTEEKQIKIDEQYVELDSLRETIHMWNIYGK